MKIKEKISELLKAIFKVKTDQPTDREEIKRRIKDLNKIMENDDKT
ncbi:MAG: hypothetical protein R6V76_09950 [Desulfobacterales bacterium]